MNIKLYNALPKLCLISLVGIGTSLFAMNNDTNDNNDKKRSIEEISNVENGENNEQFIKKQKINHENVETIIAAYVHNTEEFLRSDELKNMKPEVRDHCYSWVMQWNNTFASLLEALKKYQMTPLMKVIINRDDEILQSIENLLKQGESVSGDHISMAMRLGLKEVVMLLIAAAKKTTIQSYLLSEKNLVGLAVQFDKENDNLQGIFLELLKRGCTIDAADVLFFINEGDVDGFASIIHYIDVNMTLNTRSLLSHCIMTKNPEFVKLVVKKGARITQRDIIDNYILGVRINSWRNTSNECAYELTDACYEIANLLGGKLPKISNIMEENFTEDYTKMLKTELYQQFGKDYLLLYYIQKLGGSQGDAAREAIIKLLWAGADPNAVGNFIHQGVTVGAMSALEMAFNKQCGVTTFNLLSYGASLEEIIDNGYFDAIDDDEQEKFVLCCFWMSCLQKVPALSYDSIKKEEMQIKLYNPFLRDIDLQRRLLQFTPTFELLLNESDIDWSNVKDAVRCFYTLFHKGQVFTTLSSIYGIQNTYRYLMRYPKAAELLLLHAPYRTISNKNKNQWEQWYIQQMKKIKNASGNSAYNGFLMLGNTRLLDQTKNSKNFIDIVFE